MIKKKCRIIKKELNLEPDPGKEKVEVITF
jgi:hypothetical protein